MNNENLYYGLELPDWWPYMAINTETGEVTYTYGEYKEANTPLK